MELQWNIFVDEMKRVWSVLCNSILDVTASKKLHRGVVWNNAVVFDGNEIIRNADQFLQWAADRYNYQDTR